MAEAHYPLTGIERRMKYNSRDSALSPINASGLCYTAQQVKQLLHAIIHPSDPINVPDTDYKADTERFLAAVLDTETPDDEQFPRALTLLEQEIQKWETARNATGEDLYKRLCLLDYTEGHGFCEPTDATLLRYEALLERKKQALVKALVSGKHIPLEVYPVLFEGTWYLPPDETAPVRTSHLHVVPKPTATLIDFPEGLELGLLRASSRKTPA